MTDHTGDERKAIPSHDTLSEGAQYVADVLRNVAVDRDALARLATRFGFDQPDYIAVDGRAIDRQRKESNMSATALMNALEEAGTPTTSSEYRGWATAKSPVQLHRSTVTALAAILDVSAATLAHRDSGKPDRISLLLASHRIKKLIEDFRVSTGRTADDLLRVAQQGLMAGAFRADDVTTEQAAEIIRTIFEKLDQ